MYLFKHVRCLVTVSCSQSMIHTIDEWIATNGSRLTCSALPFFADSWSTTTAVFIKYSIYDTANWRHRWGVVLHGNAKRGDCRRTRLAPRAQAQESHNVQCATRGVCVTADGSGRGHSRHRQGPWSHVREVRSPRVLQPFATVPRGLARYVARTLSPPTIIFQRVSLRKQTSILN